MLCDHNTHVLCTQVRYDCTYVYNISVTNSVADLTPEKKGKIIGVMEIETRLKVKTIASSITCVFYQSFNVNFMKDTL